MGCIWAAARPVESANAAIEVTARLMNFMVVLHPRPLLGESLVAILSLD
jgi:hypothetical protein